ncbi:MAG: hypothetical protein JXR26_04390 [Balneolaceae bacterium]|nr:hypothetical protein [Balneolaceae bacterium]
MLKRILYFSTIAIFFTACSAGINTTSKVSYNKPSFTNESLQEGGLALLPITAGAGLEGYRRPFGNALNSYSDSLSGNMQYYGWQESMNELNEKGLADAYNEAISNYSQTSIIDKSTLQEMGNAIGARYFLYVQLGNFDKSSDTSYNMFTGLQTTRKNQVSAYAQIWDAATGDVVWEAVSNAEASSSSMMVSISENPHDYSLELAKGISEKLF